MLFLKSILLIAVLQLVLAQNEDLKLSDLPKGLDENKVFYDHLLKCARYTCSKHFRIGSKIYQPEYQSCQVGCQSSRNLAKNCANICSGEPNNYANKQLDACIKGCEHKKADEPKDSEVAVPAEPPKVINKEPTLIDDIQAPNNAEAPRVNLIDAIGALKNEDEQNKDVKSDLIDGIESIFKPFLIKGEPGTQDDPIFIEIKPVDSEEDVEENNDENSSSSEVSKEKPAVDGEKPADQVSETSSGFGFLNPFKLASIVSSVIEKAKNKIGSGNFYYYAKFLENGTVLESFEKPSESNEAMRLDDNDDAPFKIMNALLNDHRLADDDVDEEHRHAGLHPNWKGRPLPIGKPIVEDLNDYNRPPPFRMYRECRPIKFHFSTLCHDINNFFNCASMRTGLPRWFFMSLILLCSFFMLWLGIFILSMIRRMKRQERVIQYEEDQLPLYKDIVFEEKRPPTYIETEALPEKVKFETA